MGNRTLLDPGTLYESATRTSEQARQSGALQPISTTATFLTDHDIRFVVRTLNQEKAPKQRTDLAMAESVRPDPFLPYDPQLFVADITPTHLCLLNKYTVIHNHLLLVTRAFEHQQQWLTLHDMEALCTCMAEFKGLAFYNGGAAAGASQPHKHLQYVPYPMAPNGENIPLESIFTSVAHNRIETALDLPFVHALRRFSPDFCQAGEQRAQHALSLYCELLAAAGIAPDGVDDGTMQTQPYNMLATQEWMLIVPRRREAAHSISVNGLGFAGHLLARDRAQAARIAEIGPLTILMQVGLPR